MLEKIFDMDNPLMRALYTTADLIILNVLTIVCSIPIITWGAAYSALNEACWRLVKNEEGYLARTYFRSLKSNLKRGSILGLIFLCAIVIWIVDFTAARNVSLVLTVPLYVVAILLLPIAIMSFALLSRYDNTVRGTLKNAASLTIGFFPHCAAMSLLTAGFLAGTLVFFTRAVPLALLMGVSLPCYVNALIYVRIFAKLEEKK